MHKSDTPTIIGSLRILVNDIQSDDGIANMAIAEAADRMEEMQTMIDGLSGTIDSQTYSFAALRHKLEQCEDKMCKLEQKLCCFTGESLEDAADRLREEHNKAKMDADAWRERAIGRMGLMKELKDAMGIDGSEDELKAALEFLSRTRICPECNKILPKLSNDIKVLYPSQDADEEA